MSRRAVSRIVVGCLTLAALCAEGCNRKTTPVGKAETPVIPVSQPVSREVTDYVDFTGRTDAVQAVDIRARVTGYLQKLLFKEGAEVKEGDILCEIDPRPYQAQLDQAISQVTLNKASLDLARANLSRDESVIREVRGGISMQQIDQDRAAVAEALARVSAYEASTKVYRLNLEFCKVTAPISGQISRYYLTVGNLVNQDQTLLTTVVSLDPMYAYFDMDEPTLRRLRRAVTEGKIAVPEDGNVTVLMGFQEEDGYPHRGSINFVNNQVNPSTGSISFRGVFANPRSKDLLHITAGVGLASSNSLTWLPAWVLEQQQRKAGGRLLSPGMYVRIRLPIGQPHPALLITDRAIASDQGLKKVFVLDEWWWFDKVQERRVATGPLQEDGLRVITDGLKPGDWVVVGGLQQVRPRMVVEPERMAMPSLKLADEADDQDGAKQDEKQPGKKGGKK